MKTLKRKVGRPKGSKTRPAGADFDIDKSNLKANSNTAEAKTINPFVIESGVNYIGRSVATQYAQALYDKIIELPVSKTLSIAITKEIAIDKKEAYNLILTVRRMIKENLKISKNFNITSKVFKDNDGKYVMTRVWRIA